MFSCVSFGEWLKLVSDYYDAQGGVVGWLSHLRFDFSVDGR